MKNQKLKYNGGAAMMMFIIFLMFGALTVVIGIVTPVVREFKIAKDSLDSKNTYFLAESGVEDAFYRLKNSKAIGASETITLGVSSVTTTITTISGSQKEIISLGDTNSYQRRVNMLLDTGVGASFNYGVQVGQGGLDFEDGTINGNVYANGPIYGDSSTHITGSAVSANSPALSADQTNGTPPTAYNINFGNTSTTADIAQSFQVSIDNPVNKVQLYIKKTGLPANATVKIMNDNSGAPGSTVIATGTLSAASVGTSYGWVDVSFTTNPLLSYTSPSTTYWLVVDTTANASKYFTIAANNNGYASGTGKIGALGGTWNNTTPAGLDYFFSVYIGGVQGIIASTAGQYNPIHIGGLARAHTVTSANVTGVIYCQVATTNNKPCVTTSPDPEYIADPISDSNINSWKDIAAAGGTYSGNYNVGWAGATLGPKKIVGNLNVTGGATLTLTGPLWVTGNIVLDGGSHIILSSSFGTNDGYIVTDGTLSVTGGSNATGSGSAGSYILIVVLSSSTTAAAQIEGGSGAMVVYAPNGTLNLEGGASLKEATAYKVHIEGGSTLTYETGLANLNFSTGPSGSYTISSWKETE
mgnify:CR=1 FL=1